MQVIETALGPARIMEADDPFPEIRGDDWFVDFETTSFDDKVKAFQPFNGHRICGMAVTVDEAEGAWYFPFRHKNWKNFDPKILQMMKGKRWINHNVKFDAHFAWQDGFDFDGDLVCTVVQSKLCDTDRYSHDLKVLCREMGLPMEEELEVKGFLKSAKSKDYGRVPADMLGRYACMDVLGNRELFKSLDPPSKDIWDTEIRLTRTLLNMERRGMKVDLTACKRELAKSLRAMIESAEYLEKVTGMEVNGGNAFAYNLICGHLGLPVLRRTKKNDGSLGGPSFDAEAIAMYRAHPDVVTSEKARRLISEMYRYRSESHWKSLYASSFLEQHADGVLHPSYNQIVRTGRMSCSNPNSQQMNKRAKKLIVPQRERFYSTDASQIEFRFIAHYLKDPDVIRRYNEDANTDFHQWVADLCGIPRKPAKTINFAIAYGAGKARITSQLMQIDEIIERFQCDDPREYERLCREWSLNAYQTYHERLPGIKRLSEKAADLTRRRGWIRNYYHRRRHLPRKAAHLAFNTMIQGGAMDYIKRRMNELDEIGAPLIANVHDEVLFDGYVDKEQVLEILTGRDDLRVPITWDWGESTTTWADAE